MALGGALLLLGACGASGQAGYPDPAAMVKALANHGYDCTGIASVADNLLPAGVAAEGKCQVTKAPGLTSADLNVTGGVDVTFYMLRAGGDPSSLADELFHQGQAETAYGPDWVAQGSSQVYLGLGKALGGTYPPDEKADLTPT